MHQDDWAELRYFKPGEFLCKCGCGQGPEDMSFAFLKMLDKARFVYGRPILVTSGYRCPEHNTAIGGSRTSSHMFGCASDLADGSAPTTRGDLTIALVTAGFRQFEFSTDGHIHVMLDETKPSPFIGIERP